jgi:hypothetical protein
MKRVFVGVALLAASAIGASNASAAAVLFNAAGQTASISFSKDVDGAGPLGPLSATANLTVNSISTSQLVLYVELKNTTVPSGGFTTVGLESFGFSIDPNATSVTGSTAGGNDTAGDRDDFTGFGLDAIPSLSLVEICSWAGNNCNGGAQGDLLHAGETDFFVLTISWSPAAAAASFSLDNFGAKFQTNKGSYEFYSTNQPTTTVSPTTTDIVPEPALLSMLGVGLAGAAYRLRRRRA